MLLHLNHPHFRLRFALTTGKKVFITKKLSPVVSSKLEVVDILERYLYEDEGDDNVEH